VPEEEFHIVLTFDHELSDDEIEELRISVTPLKIWVNPGILDYTLRYQGPGDGN
jgi:hypothetical protein